MDGGDHVRRVLADNVKSKRGGGGGALTREEREDNAK